MFFEGGFNKEDAGGISPFRTRVMFMFMFHVRLAELDPAISERDAAGHRYSDFQASSRDFKDGG